MKYWFHRLWGNHHVGAIVATFDTVVKRLEAAAAAHHGHADRHVAIATLRTDLAAESRAHANRASAIATKVKALISPDECSGAAA